MKDKPLKAHDIAKIAGISEGNMKRIAEHYDQVIPSRILGRVKLYEEKAAGIVDKISSMEAAGKEPEEIIREFGGKIVKKSTKEKIEDKIRENQGSSAGRKKEPEGRTPNPFNTRTREDKTAFLELKLKKLTDRVKNLEVQLKAENESRERDREEFRSMINKISEKTDKTAEWVDYFDMRFDNLSSRQDEFNRNVREWIDYTEEEIDYIKTPFWKRKRR